MKKKILAALILCVLAVSLIPIPVAAATIYIHDVDDLQDMELDLTADYVLANDINALATSGWNGGAGFVPIGQSSPYFTGSLDGNGYTISDLFIYRPTEDYVGLIGETATGASITDVTLEDIDITGRDCVGGLIGYDFATGLTVNNCHVTGSVTGDDYVGGLIGEVNGTNTIIGDCDTSGTVTGGDDAVGGLIGMVAAAGFTLSDSSSTASVSSGSAAWWVGGLIGELWTTGTITQCFATGDVTGGGDRIGGFVGYIREITTISKCYATGDVESTFPLDSVGGFAGDFGSGAISDCYARGNATGGDYIGGFVGFEGGGTTTDCYSTGVPSGVADVGGFCGSKAGTITDCFWDTETSGTETSDGGTGKTTAQMKTQSTFVGWDFVTIWSIGSKNDGYPYLLWQFYEWGNGGGGHTHEDFDSVYQVLRFEPDSMIEDTTLPNEEDPGTYDGIINWGTFSQNVTITIGATTTSPDPTPPGMNPPPVNPGIVPHIPMPAGWYSCAGVSGNISSLPLYSITGPTLYDAATKIGMDVCAFYLMILIALTVAVGLSVMIFTGSVLIATIAAGSFMAVCVGTAIIGWWMVFVFIIIAAGTLYLARTA